MATLDGGAVLAVLQALADPTRLGVVELLSDGPRRAGELARATGMSAPTMSKHLRVLLRAGIVTDIRPPDDARVRMFRLRPESVVAVRAWLDQLQAQWDEQLAAFKRHVEEKR
jgi:DNA-binding transcriptional ArsR family regulator